MSLLVAVLQQGSGSWRAFFFFFPLGVGKTTLIQKATEVLKSSGVPVDGFYTEEVRQGGRRIGFDVVTLSGMRGPLSRIGYCSFISEVFFFFLTMPQGMQGLNSPTKRSNLCPLHWKGRILTTGPPGTSLCGVLFSWGPGLSQVVPSVLKNLEPLWLSWHQRKQRLKSSYETQGWKYHISVQTYSTE